MQAYRGYKGEYSIMYYTEQDMLQQIASEVTPFERQMGRAMAFGDNLALSASMITMTASLLQAEEASEANENNGVTPAITDAVYVNMIESLSNILQET